MSSRSVTVVASQVPRIPRIIGEINSADPEIVTLQDGAGAFLIPRCGGHEFPQEVWPPTSEMRLGVTFHHLWRK